MKLKEYFVMLNLPEKLLPLKEMAYNLCWTYDNEIVELFRSLNPVKWNDSTHNPIEVLFSLSQEQLERMSNDGVFLSRLESAYRDFKRNLSSVKWFDENYADLRQENFHTAYFSAEYGIHESLPLYSGGLGLLSGDHCKSAADLGLPFTAVGLLYRSGYFHQYLNSDGWQQEYYPYNEFSAMPVVPLQKNGADLIIELNMPEGLLKIKVWELKIKQIRLLLLDTDIDENRDTEMRSITGQLYGGDIEMRMKQEIVLGIGGARALKAVDLRPTVFHLNEGHPAFCSLERMRQYMDDDGLSYDKALEMVRKTSLFTTHTPVPAGFDIFQPDLFRRYIQSAFANSAIPVDELIKLGQQDPAGVNEPFNMAVLGIRTSTFRNGVSEMHGQVSRRMFNSMWPGLREGIVPIDHVTNGVHMYTWVSNEFRDLYARYFGDDWFMKPYDFSLWSHLDNIPNFEINKVKQRLRTRLVAFARTRLAQQMQAKNGLAEKAGPGFTEGVLNPDVLTIGFARRFATYKRAFLLFSDEERLARILNNPERPVQIIIAGKAHPRDAEGKKIIKQIYHATRKPEFRDKVVFLEDYDINLAKHLTAGVDLWLNNPKRPMEASGTSGMKVAMNGGVNFSVLDGWWAEGYNGKNGFAIGSDEQYISEEYENYVESRELYDRLEHDIIPLFYKNDHLGVPHEWLEIIKNSLRSLPPYFNTSRMVMEYCRKFYIPLHALSRGLTANNYAALDQFVDWQNLVRQRWSRFRIVSTDFKSDDFCAGSKATAKLVLDADVGMKPSDFCVYTFAEFNAQSDKFVNPSVIDMHFIGEESGYLVYEGKIKLSQSGKLRVAFGVFPYHKFIKNIFDNNMMLTEK